MNGNTPGSCNFVDTDFLVVGAGIAGLRAAIELAGAGRVLVITKEELDESNTHYAQGGIAVAMGGEEDVHLHLEDTIGAGDGLVNQEAAAVLVEEGPLRVEELLAWGTRFDRKDGKLMRTREGAHSLSRILHANGDATGAEIGRSLLEHARRQPNISLVEWTMSEELIVEGLGDGSGSAGGCVAGAVLLDRAGNRTVVRARAVLLASGGAGQVYSDTTNPAVATGDGIAMAYRAGAEIADMEFYQFHPTALSLPGVPRFLLSEALRGEGAWLLNSKLERFMDRYHPQLELAPRDVVARAITREGMGGGPGDSPGEGPGKSRPVYLDMRHVTSIDLVERFPGISRFLLTHGLMLSRDLIPVRPAAHYLMGGIRTDVHGRASLKRLYAAGEAACTGVHGANRLASNSLLEGLVFGARAALQMREESALPGTSKTMPAAERHAAVTPESSFESTSESTSHSATDLKAMMWEKAGLLRDGERLISALEELRHLGAQLPPVTDRETLELKNLQKIAELIVTSAFAREESRGAHYRNDYPIRDDVRFAKHSVIVKQFGVANESDTGSVRFETL